MKKEFSINIIFLLGVNLLIKPFFIFGIDRTVQNVVGTETYGVYFALLNFAYLFQILNDLGLQNFNSREISQNNQLLQKYLPNMLALKSLLAIGYVSVTVIFARILGYEIPAIQLLLIILLNQVLVSLILFLRTNISGYGYYRIDSLLSATDKLLMIIICSILLWTNILNNSFTIQDFLFAQTASLLITLLICFAVISKKLIKLSIQFNYLYLRIILKKSFPFALVILLMTLYTRIDAVMIERILADGKYQAGAYAAAYRLLDASNMFGYLFATLLLPMFSKLLKTRTGLNELIKGSFLMIWAGALPFAISVYFYRFEIMDLLYLESNNAWGEILGYLILSFIAVTGSYIFGTLLTANNSLKKMNFIFVISIIVNIILNLVLIPKFKASGAAIATLITQWFVFIAQIYLTKKEIDWKPDMEMIVKLLLFGTTIILINLAAQNIPKSQWIINFVFCLFFGILSAFLFKILNFNSLMKIIQSK